MKFEEDYYVNSTISNYKNYLHKKFRGLTHNIYTRLHFEENDRILDFGCATGGVVNSFLNIGLKNVIGTDISYWAINYGREIYNLSSNILQHYNRQLLEEPWKCILFLDVLEHIPSKELEQMFSRINSEFLVVRLPVSKNEGENFVLKVSQNDKTHIQIHTKEWWEELFYKYNYVLDQILEAKYIYDSNGVLSRVYARKIQD